MSQATSGPDEDEPLFGGDRPSSVDRRLSRLESRIDDLAHALERLLPVVDDLRDGLGDRLERIGQDIRRTNAVVDSFSASLDADTAAITRRLQDRQAASASPAATAGRLDAVVEEVADVVATATHRIAARTDEERDALVTAVVGAVEEQLARWRERGGERSAAEHAVLLEVGQLRSTVESALADQTTRIESLLTDVGRRTAVELERSRRRTDEQVERAGHGLDEVAGAMRARLAAVDAVDAERAEQVERAIRSTLGPVEALAAAVERLDLDVREGRDEARDHAEHVVALRDEVVRLREQAVARVERAVTAMEAAGQRSEEQLSAGARDAVDRMGRAASTLHEALRAASSDAATMMRTAGVEVATQLRDAGTQTADDVRAASGEAVTDVTGGTAAAAAEVRTAATEAASALRELVEEIAAGVRRAGDEAFAEVADRADKATIRFEDATRVARERVDDVTLSVREVMDAAVAAVGEDVGEVAETTRSVLEGVVEEARRELEDGLRAAGTRAREHADATMAGVEVRVGEAAERIDAAAGALAGLERIFLDYLEEQDRRVVVERAELVRQFVQQLATSLSRRERRRLARGLELPEPVPDDDATERLEEVLQAAADRSFPVAGRIREEAAPVRGDEDTDEESDVAGTDDDTAPPSDPGDIREVLAAVPGLGPAKQQALVERFGTLSAIRRASDDDLLRVKGVGPALLATLRDHLGRSPGT